MLSKCTERNINYSPPSKFGKIARLCKQKKTFHQSSHVTEKNVISTASAVWVTTYVYVHEEPLWTFSR